MNEKTIEMNILFKIKDKLLQEPYIEEKNWERYVIELVDELISEIRGERNG